MRRPIPVVAQGGGGGGGAAAGGGGGGQRRAEAGRGGWKGGGGPHFNYGKATQDPVIDSFLFDILENNFSN